VSWPLKGNSLLTIWQSVCRLCVPWSDDVLKQPGGVLLHVQGLDALAPGQKLGMLARPRLFEVAAAVNRLRTIQVVTRVPG
jgi:hypothetical protein